MTGRWTNWLAVPWRTAARRRMVGSISASALVHISLLSACALWMLAARPSRPSLAIQTVWNDLDAPQITPVQPLPLASRPDEDKDGGRSDGAALFQHADGHAGDALDLDDESLSALETAGRLPLPTAQTEMVGLTGGAGLGAEVGRGRGTGDGNGQGDATGGAFFGLEAEGRRVVYVVDASRSMNHPHPGPMKTRFGRVKLELVRAISGMSREQEFFIIYFNDKAWPMPAATMKLAVPSAQQKYLRWAVEAKASGMTDPEQALLAALTLRPDVVYFLTDGAFKRRVVDRVRIANRQGVKIHTIGFGDDEGETLLQDIAFQNLGTYQFIPEDEEEAHSQARP